VDSAGLRAVREFYEQHAQALYVYAVALTRSAEAAEDAAHDAICGVLKRGRLPSELRPYVFRCVRNAALDRLRRERPQEPVEVLDLEAAASDHFDAVLCRQVERLVLELPSDEMEVVVLHLLDGLTFREIALAKAASPNTVASWYRRGLERVRERIGERS